MCGRARPWSIARRGWSARTDSTNRYMFRINRLMDKDYELPVKALELNPRHPLMHNLSQMIAGEGDAGLIGAVVEQVFETALLQGWHSSRPVKHGESADFADASCDPDRQVRSCASRR